MGHIVRIAQICQGLGIAKSLFVMRLYESTCGRNLKRNVLRLNWLFLGYMGYLPPHVRWYYVLTARERCSVIDPLAIPRSLCRSVWLSIQNFQYTGNEPQNLSVSSLYRKIFM